VPVYNPSMTKNPSKKNLAVFFGGVSPEHEVSVITGLQVINNANKEKYRIVPVYVSKKGKWYTGKCLTQADIYRNPEKIPIRTNEVYIQPSEPATLTIKSKGIFGREKKIKVDVAFPCFHGGTGEDGSFQGLFDIANIPYVGSGVLGSSIGMDKVVMKQVLQQGKIRVTPYVYLYKSEWQRNKAEQIKNMETVLKYPLFVKPANAGSSVGVSKVEDPKQLENAIDVALAFDRKAIVETGIQNYKEINISVIGIPGEELLVSECEEVFASKEFLNYEDKYVGESGKSEGMASAKRIIPAKVSQETKKLLQGVAKKAFSVLNSSGLARVDFLVNEETGDYYLLEINTIPGSMSFYLWEATDLPFPKMIDKLVEVAEKAHALNEEKTTTFPSNILKNFKSSLKAPKLGK
jgi:D-alanine-D-alanine ligase